MVRWVVRTRGVASTRFARSLFRILEETVLGSLATVAVRGRAHVNTAYLAYGRNGDVYFLSDPHAVHCRNLRRNRSAAVTVFNTHQRWGRPDRGVQMFGTAVEVPASERPTARRLYGERFPRFRKWMQGRTPRDRRQAAVLGTYRWYRFRPRTVKLFDEVEFGGGVWVTARVRRVKRPGRSHASGVP